MERRKTDRDECEGCGQEITGDHGQCPECGAFLNRERLMRWFVGGVIVMTLLTYLVVSGGS